MNNSQKFVYNRNSLLWIIFNILCIIGTLICEYSWTNVCIICTFLWIILNIFGYNRKILLWIILKTCMYNWNFLLLITTKHVCIIRKFNCEQFLNTLVYHTNSSLLIILYICGYIGTHCCKNPQNVYNGNSLFWIILYTFVYIRTHCCKNPQNVCL